jgi:hypothetical protein
MDRAMKKGWLLVGLIPFFSGCATVTGDPWRWMDEPAAQSWLSIEAEFENKVIFFQVPTRANGSTNQVRSTKQFRSVEIPISIQVPTKTVFQATGIAAFEWDYWWGGFLKGSGADFVLTVNVGYYADISNKSFWEMSPNDYIETRQNYWRQIYSTSDDWTQRRFFESYKIKECRSFKSLTMVCENKPSRTERMTTFMVPIGQDHVLHFNFFINEKSRNGLDPDPAWVERRWEMAYKILDTVEITPRPGKF